MVFEATVLDIAIAAFVIAFLAKYTGFLEMEPRVFKLVAATGVLFLASAVFGLPEVYGTGWHVWVKNIFQILGEITAALAAIFLVYEAVKEWRRA